MPIFSPYQPESRSRSFPLFLRCQPRRRCLHSQIVLRYRLKMRNAFSELSLGKNFLLRINVSVRFNRAIPAVYCLSQRRRLQIGTLQFVCSNGLFLCFLPPHRKHSASKTLRSVRLAPPDRRLKTLRSITLQILSSVSCLPIRDSVRKRTLSFAKLTPFCTRFPFSYLYYSTFFSFVNTFFEKK